ncbi:MAG: AMP-binding protein [Solirubrobacterales bacterium]|nr:AMP-binding protein [Solirubrobacterales bacterium]
MARLPPWFEPDRWVPPPGTIERRRVARLMQRHDIECYADLLARAAAEPEWFYPAAFDDLGLDWPVPFERLCDDGDPAAVRWFIGGRTNVVQLAVDRWADVPLPALIHERDDGETTALSFGELSDAVARCAGGLRRLGVGRGDVVAVYLPMIPEAAIALLAAARIGAIAAPAFSGYGAEALAERLQIAGAKVLVTAEGFHRRGRAVPLLETAERAAAAAPSVETVQVVGGSWTALMRCEPDGPAPLLPADAPWLLAFTSGSTGRPKGAVHTHGGLPYRVPIELAYNLDLACGERLAWVTDMGWIMGPLALVGSLALGATCVFFEGPPDHPRPDRLWADVERLEITHLGLSPTLVRMLAGYGAEWVDRHALPTLRVLGSTGEPWTSEAWRWLHRHVGRARAPIINWSGGTEIGGGILVGSPVVPIREGRFSGPAPGMSVAAFGSAGRPVVGEPGELVITRPWPSMTRGLWNEPQRFLETYWSRWPGVWTHGDRAVCHTDGSWELLGRSDDVLKIAGKRVGPVEVEAAATAGGLVREAAAVGVADPVKGQTLVVLVVPSAGAEGDLSERVSDRVAEALGAPLRPAAVLAVDELPLSLSGKVQRRVARAWLSGTDPGDLSTVANPQAAAGVAAAGERWRAGTLVPSHR